MCHLAQVGLLKNRPLITLILKFTSQAFGECAHLVPLHDLPDVVRQVEGDPLHDEEHGHPLVVGVVDSVAILVSSDAGVRVPRILQSAFRICRNNQYPDLGSIL